MIDTKVPTGFVRALVERPKDKEGLLVAAAQALLSGENPLRHMTAYAERIARELPGLIVEPSFGAIPVGRGVEIEPADNPEVCLEAVKAERFLVNAFVERRGDDVPEYLVEDEKRYPVFSNPLLGELLAPPPCLPTCGTSQYVGDTTTVQNKLDVPRLNRAGLDGTGVAIAIVDSGIYRPRIERLLGEAMSTASRVVNLDEGRSWRPADLVTKPGGHRLGHGTMCAYDALIAAPKATLLDIPMLLARDVADHRVTGSVAAATWAYYHLMIRRSNPAFPYSALVVSNSWGIFHPCLEDFPPGHRYRFIDNSNHFFHRMIWGLSKLGVDIVFCGNNCGDGKNCAGECASGTCLSKTNHTIMGANSYQEVLTVGGCDTDDRLAGYSSRGPSITGMFPQKPDLVAYTHFLGSKVSRTWIPDTGVSAACPVAAGCVAALRTGLSPSAVPPARLFKALRDTAYLPGGGAGWDPGFGYGIIKPVAAGRALGLPIP